MMIKNLLRTISAAAVVALGLSLPFSYASSQNPFGGASGEAQVAEVEQNPAHQDNPAAANVDPAKKTDAASDAAKAGKEKVPEAIRIHTEKVNAHLESEEKNPDVFKSATPVSDAMPSDIDKDTKVEPVLSGKKLAGRMVWVKGDVTAKSAGDPDGAERKLKKHSNIYVNDVLKTGDRSTGQVVFTDDSSMSFRPNTEFKVDDYEYKKEEPQKGKYVMGLVKGGFRTVTGKVGKDKPDEYEIVTPVATIGVRGTEFSVVYKDKDGLKIKRYNGEPCVTNTPVGDSAKKKDKKDKTLCLDQDTKYAAVDARGDAPVALAEQPAEFGWDVSVVPVSFGYPGGGPGGDVGGGIFDGLGGGGFCIQ